MVAMTSRVHTLYFYFRFLSKDKWFRSITVENHYVPLLTQILQCSCLRKMSNDFSRESKSQLSFSVFSKAKFHILKELVQFLKLPAFNLFFSLPSVVPDGSKYIVSV